MENIPTNPLNTGNGAPSTTPVNPPAPAPMPMPTPAPAPFSNTPTPTTQSTPENPLEKIMAMKKYIIIGIGVIALLVSIYMAYAYFTGIGSAVQEVQNTTKDLNNKLGAPSNNSTSPDTTTTDKTKLNNVVNELKDQYKTDTSNPPGISITPDNSAPAPTDTSTPSSTTTDTSTGGGVKR